MSNVQIGTRRIETLLDAQWLSQLDRARQLAREIFLRNDLQCAAPYFIHLLFDRCEFNLRHALSGASVFHRRVR
jgi:hypothetical protein